MKHNKVIHEKNVILTVVTEEVPRVDESRRLTVETLSDRFSRMVVRFGFMETPHVPRALEAAGYDVKNTSFFLSRRTPFRSLRLPLWQDHLFINLARSASDVSNHFCIPEDRAVEIGAQVVI